jgi:hypothetical protein
MKSLRVLVLAFAIFAFNLGVSTNRLSAFGITEGATTALVFQGVMSELNQTLNSALSQGNFIVWHAGVQARLALERWGEVNRELMDKAFSELDGQQRLFFRNLNDAIRNIDASSDKISADAQALLDQTQQIVADIRFWDGQPTVLRYGPTLLLLEKRTPKEVLIQGLNLQDSNPELWLNVDGEEIKLERVALAQQSARFTIPEGLLSSSDLEPKKIRGQIRLQHKKSRWLGLFGTEIREIRTELNVIILPKYLGELTDIETFKRERVRKYTDWKSREFHFSSGSISEQCEVQTQNPSLDHKIDVDTVDVWQNRPNPNAGQRISFFVQPATLPGAWGKAGSARLETKSTEGFAVRVCAKRWTCCFPPDTGPGYQHIVYRWKEFKESDELKKLTHPPARVSWLADVLVRTEPGSEGLLATVKLFSGEQRIEIRERLNGKYYLVEFEPRTGVMLLKPQIPTQLSAIMN